MRNSLGQFKRKHGPWSVDNNEDGWIGKRSGRYMVFVPGHPKASKTGYITRALATWEHYNGPLPSGWVVHHKNQNRLDDSIENLEGMTKEAHDYHHKLTQRKGVYRNCKKCGVEIYVPNWRLREGRRGEFCADPKCYTSERWAHHAVVADASCAICGSTFKQRLYNKALKRDCCSQACSSKKGWIKRRASA